MEKECIENAFDEYYRKYGTGDWHEDEIMKDAFISGYLSGIGYLLGLSFDDLKCEYEKYQMIHRD